MSQGPQPAIPVRAERRLGELVAISEGHGLLRTVLPGTGTGPGSVRVRGVVYDSRRVQPGSLFVAVPGEHADGHEFAAAAVEAGAVAIVAERAVPGLGVPQLLVAEARPALALAAAWLHGFPSHRLGVVGITGTDGKTTTAYMVRAILEESGIPSGLLGTVEVVVGGRELGNPARTTTPEAPELQAHLAAMVAAGDKFAVVESSSHGLAQDRVAEVAYDIGVLTNLSHEHLEFHRTLEAYRAAKLRLFERLATGEGNPNKGWTKTGVINLDDAAAADFIAATRDAGARVLTYGTDTSADVRPLSVEEDARRVRIAVQTPRWKGKVSLAMAGRFNVHNALAAVTVGESLGLEPVAIRAGLANLPAIPGRMERIDAGQPFTVVVDYAHTPESLAKVLDNLAPLAAASRGGLITVLGSAGERDVAKRPMLGRVAGERCRVVVVTDEDPRGEDRMRILEEIAEGAERAGKRRGQDLLLIADRAEAIGAAFEQARPGDIVLLAGKGHEKTIEIGGGAIPWDEAAAARDALAGLGYRQRA
jgi:UDP-N-acetylmuramoyl-L-alanyl-D-glutamate--2,6-diaminopimelate ligase